MGMISEFKEFAFKGNMMDMAIGLVLGGAFGTVIKSLVDDVLSPVVGLVSGKDFSALALPLTDSAKAAVTGEDGSVAKAIENGEALLGYGLFINAFIAFLITAFALFLVVKSINKARNAAEGPAEEEVAATPANEVLLAEIRDLLKKNA